MPTITPTTSDSSSTLTTISQPSEIDEKIMRDLHTLLLETEVREGKMVCGNCGHEYKIKEGIANFLLPSHLGKLILTGLQNYMVKCHEGSTFCYRKESRGH